MRKLLLILKNLCRAIPPNELPGVLGATQYLRAPDLQETSFVNGFDFVHEDSHPNDDQDHGTFVTAVIAQDTNNGFRGAGIAPRVSIMPVKVANEKGHVNLADLIEGMAFAIHEKADVMNLSLSFPPEGAGPESDEDFAGLTEQIEAAYDAGIVVVASSDNLGLDVIPRPANHPLVIAVASSAFAGQVPTLTAHSSLGEAAAGIPPAPGLPGELELLAPIGNPQLDEDGNGLLDGIIQESMVANNPEVFLAFRRCGSSFAAPQVSAVAALLISAGMRPEKDPAGVDLVRQILRDTATDFATPGPDLVTGAGELHAGRALTAVKVRICHRHPHDVEKSQTLHLPLLAARAHLRHGDTAGPCR